MIVVQRDILTKPSSFSMIAQPLQPHCRLSPHKCLHLLMPAITLPLCLASCTPSPASIAVCTPPAGPLLMGPDHTQCLLAATMSKMRQPLQQCPCVFPAKPLSLASSAVYRLRGRLGGSMWLHWSQGPCSCLQAQPLSQLTPLLQLVTSPSICVPACPPTWSLTPVSTALCTHRHRMCSHRRALWQPRPWQLQVSLELVWPCHLPQAQSLSACLPLLLPLWRQWQLTHRAKCVKTTVFSHHCSLLLSYWNETSHLKTPWTHHSAHQGQHSCRHCGH